METKTTKKPTAKKVAKKRASKKTAAKKATTKPTTKAATKTTEKAPIEGVLIPAKMSEMGVVLPDLIPRETAENLLDMIGAINYFEGNEKDFETIPDVTTAEGMGAAKARVKLMTANINIGDKARLASTKPLRDVTDQINKAWKKYESQFQGIRDAHKEVIDAEARKEELAQEAALAADEARKERHQETITIISNTTAGLIDSPKETKLEALAKLSEMNPKDFEEFENLAVAAITIAHNSLQKLIDRDEEMERLRAAAQTVEAMTENNEPQPEPIPSKPFAFEAEVSVPAPAEEIDEALDGLEPPPPALSSSEIHAAIAEEEDERRETQEADDMPNFGAPVRTYGPATATLKTAPSFSENQAEARRILGWLKEIDDPDPVKSPKLAGLVGNLLSARRMAKEHCFYLLNT